MSDWKSFTPYLLDFLVIFGLGLVADWFRRSDPLDLGQWRIALVVVVWLLGLGFYLLRERSRRHA